MSPIEAQAIAARSIRSGAIQPAKNAPASPRRNRKLNVPVHRRDFPAGRDGQRAYARAYWRCLRALDGFSPFSRKVPVDKTAYPNTPEGQRQYRRDYGMAYRRLKGWVQ